MNSGLVVHILGVVNLILLFLQIGTGFRWIKLSMKIHRKAGITLFITATIHGTLAFLSD